MVMLEAGLNKVRDLHGAGITSAWIGTDGTTPVESQISLIGGIRSSILVVTVTTATKTNIVEYTLPSTIATAQTIREFATVGTGSVDFNRRTYTGIEHTENDDVIFRQSFYYRNP